MEDGCYLFVGEYENNGHVAIEIWSEDEGYLDDITINIRGIENRLLDCSCVNIHKFPEATRIIQELGIGKYLGYELVSGWNAYPVYEFNMEQLKKYTKE